VKTNKHIRTRKGRRHIRNAFFDLEDATVAFSRRLFTIELVKRLFIGVAPARRPSAQARAGSNFLYSNSDKTNGFVSKPGRGSEPDWF
jgi:hypothetical protein